MAIETMAVCANTSIPVPAVLTIVALIAIGIALWRAAAWPWLAVGAVIMFVAAPNLIRSIWRIKVVDPAKEAATTPQLPTAPI